MPLDYMSGFQNHFQTEAIKGALPKHQNSPQRCPLGLYAEQINGSAFTAPRRDNLVSWQYRIRPSVMHSHEFTLYQQTNFIGAPITDSITPPTQLRWNPLPIPTKPTHFIDGIHTMCANGHASSAGGAIHLYACNQSMEQSFFYNADGDLLIVPQQGGLIIHTEFGIIDIEPTEIAVIQRGIRFQIKLKHKQARGYICETYGAPFELPSRGPIGANGLAEDRHFLTPTAAFEDNHGEFELICKFQGRCFSSHIKHSPLDVVAWFGNYAPYKYDLKLFNPVWSVGWDHSDPSIFTVLTSPSTTVGTANIDFVIFPARWMVVEHTFRPPYYHRNIMSEYMGLIHGVYDAKAHGFEPGGSSLHNCMTPHGVDKDTFDQASSSKLQPHKYDDTLAFMFESSLIWNTTRFALDSDMRQHDYIHCWNGLESQFNRD